MGYLQQVLVKTLLFLSALFLWLGSQETPWALRTWKGESERERAFQRRRDRYARAGLLLLTLGYLFDLTELVLGK